MNKLTQEKVATSLLKACKDEGLMYKEAAKIFNTEPAYFKMLEREDKREAIPEKVMDRFHSWVYSGKKLKEYKMPGSFEEAQREADTGIENPVMEELADMLNEHGAVILEPTKEPVIKLKPGALAKRKKEIKEKKLKLKLIPATEKPKRKYTRKPKEITPEVREQMVAGAPVPADKYIAEAVPEGTPFTPIPEQKVDAIGLLWLKICPERQMIDAASIQSIADELDIPFGFVKEIIEREIEHDEQLIAQIMEQPKDAFCKESNGHTINIDNVTKHVLNRKEEVVPCNPQPEDSETDLLRSEIKTLSFLLAKEHEANEVLRAQNGYLNARIAYKVNKATDIIRELNKENNALRDKAKSIDDRILGYKIGDIIEKVNRLRKENNELEDQIRKYLRQGFWARVFNRPVK